MNAACLESRRREEKATWETNSIGRRFKKFSWMPTLRSSAPMVGRKRGKFGGDEYLECWIDYYERN